MEEKRKMTCLQTRVNFPSMTEDLIRFCKRLQTTGTFGLPSVAELEAVAVAQGWDVNKIADIFNAVDEIAAKVQTIEDVSGVSIDAD